MRLFVCIWLFFGVLLVSCREYTPKPSGYFRIEPDTPRYASLALRNRPYTFHVSQLVQADTLSGSGWLILSYPSLNVKIYCSYFPITALLLPEMERESRSFVLRHAGSREKIVEQVYANPVAQVYGSLFLLDEASASPIQFMLTDSSSRFFRGTLLYEGRMNADSLAPVIDYLRRDVITLMETFTWR